MELITRFLRPPLQSFFLFGPRGTGKSLWTESVFSNALRIDLLEPDTFRFYSSRPERLKEFIAGNPGKQQIVIDEIQKVPDLLSVTHQLIEKHKTLQFILTGSSARKLKRSGINLLGGRALLRNLHPFMATELGSHFDMDRALQYGLLPLVWGSKDPKDVLGAYHQLYIQEEVQTEALVRSIGDFSRFLEAMSFSHASVLNLSNIARECEVERKTVEGYFHILEDLLLCFRIPVFNKRAKRGLVKHHKIYFFDAGVFRTIRPKGPLDGTTEMEGMTLEGLVAQHLRAWNAYRGEINTLYYWRTRSGVEVDFILYGEDGLWGFEVKNATQVYSKDLRALQAFKEDYPESQVVLLYRGTHRLKKEGIFCIPCNAFFLKLHPERSLSEILN